MTTQAQLIKCVCYWLDSVSDPDEPEWIVSIDTIDRETGTAELTDTEDVCETEEEAIESAKELGEKLGLPVYENNGGGPPVLIQEA